jgi:hypothetical protein
MLALAGSQPAFCTPAEVILLRHGEKPATHRDRDLSERGQQRARALASFLTANPVLLTNGLPVALFAPLPSARGHGRRPLETLTPLADRLGLSVQTPVKASEHAELARRILADPALDGKTVVICWVHHDLRALARELGVHPAPARWKASVYDRVWVITYHANRATLSSVPEHLLPGDS